MFWNGYGRDIDHRAKRGIGTTYVDDFQQRFDNAGEFFSEDAAHGTWLRTRSSVDYPGGAQRTQQYSGRSVHRIVGRSSRA